MVNLVLVAIGALNAGLATHEALVDGHPMRVAFCVGCAVICCFTALVRP